jgi:arylsulfatase A-like enzyme
MERSPIVRPLLVAAISTGLAGGLVLGALLATSGGGVVAGAGRKALLVLNTAAVQGLALGLLCLVAGVAGAVVVRALGVGAAARRVETVVGPVALFLVGAYAVDRWLSELLPAAPRPWTGLLAGVVLGGMVHLARRWLDRARGVAFPLLAGCALLVVVVGAAWGRSPAPPATAGPVTAAEARTAENPSEPATPPTFPRPRNVVFIVIDTLRADRLSCYGYPQPTSPRLDRLAAEGVRFEHAIVQKSKTSPSVASLLTGTYPHTHGIVTSSSWLPDEAVTLPEILDDAGWTTAAFVANSGVSATFNFHQGFRTHVQVKKREGGNHAERVSRHVLPWLEENHAEPFFLYVHYIDPHSPYDPPEPFRGRFTGDDLYAPFRDVRLPIGETFTRMIFEKAVIDDGATELALYLARYDEEIAYVDAEVGRLLATLKELGREEDTLVVFTSDHGESLYEHEIYFNHGLYAYEDNIRVPLVLRYPPALESGRVEEDVVESIDLMPTILEMLGLPPHPEVEGQSLVALLLGAGDARPRSAFAEGGYDKENLIRAIRTRNWKLIFNPKGADLHADPFRARILLSPTRTRTLLNAVHGGPGSTARWELYDVSEDPAEEVNLVERRPEVFASLQRDLEAWMALAPAERNPRVIDPGDLPEDVLEELRALGYIP